MNLNEILKAANTAKSDVDRLQNRVNNTLGDSFWPRSVEQTLSDSQSASDLLLNQANAQLDEANNLPNVMTEAGRSNLRNDAADNMSKAYALTSQSAALLTATNKYQEVSNRAAAALKTDADMKLHDSIHTFAQLNGKDIHRSVVDNYEDPAPVQGFDVEIWAERYPGQEANDKQSLLLTEDGILKNLVLIGSFQEISLKVTSHSFKFFEADSRSPIILDGAWAIMYALTKGLVDMELLEHTFGLRNIGGQVRFNRMPRTRITFNVDPRSLGFQGQALNELNQHVVTGNSLPKEIRSVADPNTGAQVIERQEPNSERYPLGRYVLDGAKCQDLTIHAGASGKVVMNQWSGEAEALSAISFTEQLNGVEMRYTPLHGGNAAPINATILAPAAMTDDPEIAEMIRRRIAADRITSAISTVSQTVQGTLGLLGNF